MRYLTFGILAAAGAILFAAGASAQPVPTAPPDFAATSEARLNYYRAMAKLPPIDIDDRLSKAAYFHARYLVKNGIGGGNIILGQQAMHIRVPQGAARLELEGEPFYSVEGASLGPNAVVLSARDIALGGAEFIDLFLTMPFSGMGPIVPQFSTVGVGAYCDRSKCAIVIPYRFGLAESNRMALYRGPVNDQLWKASNGVVPIEAGRLRSPVEFPPDGSTVTLTSYPGHDFPDPISACPFYSAPTGAPISLQLGQGYGPHGSLEISAHRVTRDGVALETCLLTAASYQGRTRNETEAGRQTLKRFGAAIILPRAPLARGRYEVSLTEGGKPYHWRFTVASAASPAASPTR